MPLTPTTDRRRLASAPQTQIGDEASQLGDEASRAGDGASNPSLEVPTPMSDPSEPTPAAPTLGTGAERGLDPSLEEMRRLGYAAVDAVLADQGRLSDRRVARRADSPQLLASIDEPLPRQGLGADSSIDFLFERIVPAMTRVNHPRFHAYIPVPGSFYGFLGELLAAGTNAFVGSWLGGASFVTLELVVLRWIAEAVGYPGEAAGVLTSGGSLANLTGLAAARERYGPTGLERGVLYVSDQGHHSFAKAARVLGFRDESLRVIESDHEFRLDCRQLHDQIRADRHAGRLPMLVCANAGTTNTGAVDPLDEIADLCAGENLWLHVDGAYGGFAALSEHGRGLLRGMDRADSLTLDPHKWLYVPMGVGCALCRHRELLERAFRSDAHYLQDVPRHEVNFFDRGPELSRPARALSVWMLIRSVGLDRLCREVEHDLELARLAETLIAEDPDLEVVVPTSLSIVVFRHRLRFGETEQQRSARDRLLVEAILEDGTLMLSSTDLGGRTALRLVVMNHRTTESEVRRSVAAIRRIASAPPT